MGSVRITAALAGVLVLVLLPFPPVGAGAGAQTGPPAFPGAEGFGAGATGGRGGAVVRVTTLEPFGPGSLGAALDPEVCEPRIVVFRVSGVIDGELDLTCGDVTVAGQTAPGAGITVRGRIDGYGADPGGNIIIRHLRVRPPPPAPDKATFHGAIQLSNNPRVILDHVSASWAVDEVVDLFEGSSDVTVQWSTIEESRTESHPEGAHNYGMILGPDVPRVSIHHTLFAHHRARCPAVAAGPAEIINTVAYNCRDGFVHHNPAAGEFHLTANTYRSGPDTDDLVPFFFDDEDPGDVGYHLAGNRIDDPGVFVGVVDNIWERPAPHAGLEEAGGEEFALDRPAEFGGEGHVPVSAQGAQAAFDAVLAGAGAFPRDAVTIRTLTEVADRAGGWGAEEPADLLAGLTPTDPPTDGDEDGMADDWEAARGLDPDNGTDHTTVMESGYTAVEEYVNELADDLVAGAGGPVTSGGGTGDDGARDRTGVATARDRLPAASDSGASPAAMWLAVAALMVAVVALAVAGLALSRASRSAGDVHSP